MRRIVVLLMTLTMARGLTAEASPAQAETQHSVSWWLAYEKGKTLGPGADSGYGKMTITGFSYDAVV